jgi:hypothetical protein
MRDEPEHPDLVEMFYHPFLRPLGNLVILFARAEGALLEFVTAMHGGDEKAANEVLKSTNCKAQVEALAKKADLWSYTQQELNEATKGFFDDKKHRNRLMHDEWFVGIAGDDDDARAAPMTRGIPRGKVFDVIWAEPKVQEIWELSRRFREYRSIFGHAARFIHERPGQQA